MIDKQVAEQVRPTPPQEKELGRYLNKFSHAHVRIHTHILEPIKRFKKRGVR